MQLRRLLLKNFRRFDHLEINFERGLNLVKGPNEAGKSTLQDAIITGLLDRPTGKQKERRYQQWGQDRLYEIDLSYLSSEGEEFTISKDFEAKTHQVLSPDGSDNSKAGLESAVNDAIGTLSQDLFVSTVCIRQDAMTDVDEGADEISSQLQGIVMGGDGVVDQVIDRLSKRVASFERGWKTNAPINPGPIKQLQKRIEEIELEISRIKPEVLRVEGASEELQSLKERLEDTRRTLRLQRAQYEIHTKKRELSGRLGEQRQREGELEGMIEKVVEVSDLLAKKQAQLEEFSSISVLSEEKRNAIHDAYENHKARSIEAKDRETRLIEFLERRESESEPDSRLRRAPSWPPALLLGLGIPLGIWGIIMLLIPERMLFAQFGPILTILGGILGFAGGLLLVRNWRVSQASKMEDHDQVAEIRKRSEEGAMAQQDALQILATMLGSLGYESWDEYQNDSKKSEEINSELVAAESALEALISSEDELQALKASREGASRERRDTEEQIRELEAYGDLSSIEFQRMVSDIDELEGEESELKDQLTRSKTIIEGGGPTIGDLHRYEELRAANQRKLEHATDRHEVYGIALEGMRLAREHSMRTAQDELEPRLNGYLKQVTTGRYDRALVDKDLGLRVLHPSKEGGPIEMDELSQGARDQVYLSARIALCDLIFGDARPPLLMDDPFVKFDPERREAALRLCKDLAADRQIILFTCHDGYDAFADHVIELE
jgi:uncharacterized protein YhaN